MAELIILFFRLKSTNAVQLWRLNIKPDADDDIDPRQFCIQNNILGFGWPIDTDSDDVEWEEYENKASAKYGSDWRTAVRGLHDRMEEGDLCWTRDRDGSYFLGKVGGSWRYEGGTQHRKADIVNVRDCEWVRVGSPDGVPGKVINSLNVQRTLQRVNGDSIREYSRMLFHRLSGSEDSGEIEGDEIFDLIHPEDCEDLVGLYLQKQGYRLIPSTCKKSTMQYEYILKHRETGEKAYAQVKQGSVSLNAEDYEQDEGSVFLFTTGGEQEKEAPNVEFIEPSTIRKFIEEELHILPDRVQAWMKVVKDGQS